MSCRIDRPHPSHSYLADSDAITLSFCKGVKKMAVRHHGNGDVEFDVEMGSDGEATLTVEWSRVTSRPGWVCLRPNTSSGFSYAPAPVWVKAENIEAFAEAVREAGQGNPQCPHCEGSGKRHR
jgi:hypothetical protein